MLVTGHGREGALAEASSTFGEKILDSLLDVGFALCAVGGDGQVVGHIGGLSREAWAPGKMKPVERGIGRGTLRAAVSKVPQGHQSLENRARPGGVAARG